MLTNAVSVFAITCLGMAGYFGAAFLMALESMIFPFPARQSCLSWVFLVADGKWNLELAILATSAGSLIGSLISYMTGYYGGKPFILKVGKCFLLNRHDLKMTEDFFSRRGGTSLLFVSRFIPVVRHLVSIPAGIGKMRLLPFVLATVMGSTLWNSFLLVCGMFLRDHWRVVMTYSHEVDIVVGAVLLAGLIWFVKSRYKMRKEARWAEID